MNFKNIIKLKEKLLQVLSKEHKLVTFEAITQKHSNKYKCRSCRHLHKKFNVPANM